MRKVLYSVSLLALVLAPILAQGQIAYVPPAPHVSVTKSVSVETASVGDEVTYTIEATNDNSAETTPLDVMLVIDDSGSMSSVVGCSDPTYFDEINCIANGGTWSNLSKMETAKTAAIDFVNQLGTNDQSGAVSFSSSASLIQALTFTHTNTTTAITGLSAGGGTNIASGVTTAHAEFTAHGRTAPTKQVMIVLSDGVGGDPSTAATAAKADGIRIISIGLGYGVDETTMKNMASSDADYYFAPSGAELAAIYTGILGTLCDEQDLTITDDITDVLVDATLVSTNPAAIQTGNELSWSFAGVGCGETVTASFVVQVDDAKATDGSIMENTAVASNARQQQVSSNTVQTAIDMPQPVVLGEETHPALSISKSVDASFANPKQTVTYTIMVANTGDGLAENVTLIDTLPAGLQYTDTVAPEKAWELGDIAVGETKTITYDVIVLQNTAAGTYVNTVVGWADDVANVTDTASLEVRIPVVLGAESLPVTGGSSLMLIVPTLVGLGAVLLSNRKRK